MNPFNVLFTKIYQNTSKLYIKTTTVSLMQICDHQLLNYKFNNLGQYTKKTYVNNFQQANPWGNKHKKDVVLLET